MIVNPIIPIWLMVIISVSLIILVLYNKQIKEIILNTQSNERTERQKSLLKNYIISATIKISAIILLFIINLRIMLPNGDGKLMNSDYNVLFVIDTSVSMRALDYKRLLLYCR